ncbi:MAG: CBS domain-containing protein [Holophagales bacterium]|nr:MAG: CBS domain-containing protein [Holophagales bacterium]
MEIIVTHVGADFDAFAAMIAAQRLHPGARLFFPGSREESLRRALAAGLWRCDEIRRKEIDPTRLARVILCDIRQPERIGVVADWLRSGAAIEVLAYDHHPNGVGDVIANGGLVDPAAGATSTLMTEELTRRGLDIEPGLATLLLLGIYEDTGALTYATTGPRDLRAAAVLVERGGDLGAVRRYAQRALDAPHLAVLYRMVEGMEIHRLRGHRVGLVALELGEYVEELAPLVSRCLELQSLELFVAVFGEGERVTVIARGEVAGVHLGRLLAPAGGGGHATAASAAWRGVTLVEARERILELVALALPPVGAAKDLMVASFVAVEANRTIAEGKELLLRGKVNAAPVVADGRVVGSVSRQQLDAALQHGLELRPIATAMSAEVRWVPPDASLEAAAEALLQGGPAGRFLLVGDRESGRADGLVSRLALMSHLHSRLVAEGRSLDRRVGSERMRHRRVERLIAESTGPAVQRRLAAIRELAGALDARVYAVGGFVRDLLLGRPNEDLDLVVEGDGSAFARALAERLGGRVREHPEFLTAVVIDAEGLAIDIASARSEFYRAPAALPEVQSSVLRQDLYRRDFTINTLALRLGGERDCELLDFFGGERDLDERVLRVLHSLSFLDDPTRMLRAVRFEVRLGCHLGAETLRLVEVALAEGAFARLSGERLRDELALILDVCEQLPRSIARLAELGILRELHPGLRLDEAMTARLGHVAAVSSWWRLSGLTLGRLEPWLLSLFALARGLESAQRHELAGRLGLAGDRAARLGDLDERLAPASRLLERGDQTEPHVLTDLLAPLPGEELLLLMAEADEAGRAAVRRYLGEWRGFHPRLRGRDLVAAGWAPGPGIGQALRCVWAARLDGHVTESEELDLAIAWLSGRYRRTAKSPGAVP